MFNIDSFQQIQDKIKENSPLIHCITNPISINDCANFILAMGGKPIMAEHPLEVEEITATANSLALNIANITDARLNSIMLSAKTADKLSIPFIIDIVGVNCSALRLEYAKKLLNTAPPTIIKGNMAEIKAISNIKTNSRGIDTARADAVSIYNLDKSIDIVKKLAKEYKCIVMASGKIDIISDGHIAYTVTNGNENLGLITGTGCILNAVTATYLSVTQPLDACIFATAVLGISGEKADSSKGVGTFKTELIDKFSLIKQEDLSCMARIKLYSQNNL